MARLSLSRMPWKNIKAHLARAAVIALLAAAQAACVIAGAVLAAGAQGELSLAEERLGADVLVYPYEASYHLDMGRLVMQGTPVAAYGKRSDLDRMANCDGIAAVTHQIYLPGLEGGPAWVVGFEPDTDFALSPWIAEGRGFALPAGTALAGSGVDASGGTVDLYGRAWPVGAHLEETGSALDVAVFISMDDLGTVLADAAACGAEGAADIDPARDYSAALVRVADKESVESVANWLKVYVRGTKAVRSDEALTATASGISWQSAIVGVLAAAAWAVLLAALVVAQFMSMRERAGELFVWRASGASRRAVARVLRRESLMLHVAGALAGSAVAGAAATLLAPGAPVAAPAALAVGLSALAGRASSSIATKHAMDELDGQMLVAA